ncbi:alpha/beta hydrolase [Pseudomarimonas arenosa]|uniref:Alpha/beta hydrolase n=1 Tax=Pseudomarimonas arenosa TaxID=2774145 RepID=A0AAW3ZJ58_9GAMM|nr:alpha/beta hydrolase [Pseudomarimonas arenosa]MBD8526110.1 alpha/beta hydrolase [Pseudomarimonas arenosa]
MKLAAPSRIAMLRTFSLCALLLLGAGCKTLSIADKDLLPKTPDPTDAPTIETSLAGQDFQLRIHQISAHDGTLLHAAQVIRDPSFPTVLYFGGNVSRVSRELPMLVKETADMQVNLLMTDHRGNGRSAGTASLLAHYHDGLAAYDFARHELGIAAEQLVVHGMSMGSMKASYVALHRPVAGLVLEGSATTSEQWADTIMPWYAKPFVRIELAESLRGQGALYAVKHQSAPLLVIVGSKDTQTKPVLSQRLYEAARQAGYSAELLVVKGAGHGNALGFADAQQSYSRWLNAVLGRPAKLAAQH